MSFAYIDWVKEHYTEEQKAAINMATNEYDRAMQTASKHLDKEAMYEFICNNGYGAELAELKHKHFEETNAKLNS